MKRVFLIVLDSFGIGEMPDAEAYGDINVNTLRSVSKSPYFHMEHMRDMGLFQIDGVSVGEKTEHPTAAYARMTERSRGKDTTIGHWELPVSIRQSLFLRIPTVSRRRFWKSSGCAPEEIFCVINLIPAPRSLRIMGMNTYAPAS